MSLYLPPARRLFDWWLTTIIERCLGGRDVIRNTYPVLLQPDTEYVVQLRSIKTSTEFSPWCNFTFRTAPQFTNRPSPPQNLRVTQKMGAQVMLEWDAHSSETAPFGYEYYLDGVKVPLTRCGGAYLFCTEADFRTVTFDTGSSTLFGVAARDSDLNLSLQAQLDLTK